MYQGFFGLKELPFNVTSDPAYLFMSRRHKEALAHLSFGIQERKGFIEITGEVGTGKTTLCRALLNQLDSHTKTAFIFNSNLTELQLLTTIIDDFGIKPKRRDRTALFNELNRFLIDELAQGNNVVLIIDEAQNLRLQLLEQIRMLSNLETEKEKLFQIVLVGQPELREKLRSPSLRQLRQRIAVRYHIEPLDKEELPLYVRHRLQVAGGNGTTDALFQPKALEEVYKYSQGIPRLINVICDKSLLLAFVLEERSVTPDMIKKAIHEIEGGN